MKLSDVMANAGLVFYAEVALVLFLFAFAGVVFWTMAPSRRASLERHRAMALDDVPDAPEPGER